jgi:hypothetical protein
VLSLDSISFDAGGTAIRLRFDGRHVVPSPEWVSDRNRLAADSPVLYELAKLASGEVRIQARFSGSEGRTFLVQAIANESSPLGDIAPFTVDFPASDPLETWINLYPKCPSGVAADDQSWQWQWKVNEGDAWQDLMESNHRIYVIFGLPGSPWSVETSAEEAWPWASALELACNWMCGADCYQSAADLLVRRILEISHPPKPLFTYSGGNSSFVVDGSFKLQRFLDATWDLPHANHKVDCRDSSTIVATLVNLVGGRLAEARINGKRGDDFAINTNIPLGASLLQAHPPFFNFHEVGWRGPAGPSGIIWDICLRLPSTRVGAKPNDALPSIGVPFGRPGDAGYLDRLVAPKFRNAIRVTKPASNRPVYTMPSSADHIDETNAFVQGLFDASSPGTATGQRVFVWPLVFDGTEFTGWTLFSQETEALRDGVVYLDAYWKKSSTDAATVRVEAYIAHSQGDAEAVAIKLLSQRSLSTRDIVISRPDLNSVETSEGGAQAGPQVFGNVMFQVRNVGYEDVPLDEFLKTIRFLILDKPDAPLVPGPPVPKPDKSGAIQLPLPDVPAGGWRKAYSAGSPFRQLDQVYFIPPVGVDLIPDVEIFLMQGSKAVGKVTVALG